MSNFNGFTGNNDPVYYSRQTENTDGALTGEDTRQAGNSPAIPDGYVLVPKEATKEILDEFDSIIDYGAEDSVDAWHRLLAAATQEPKP